ncbi:hypothetical protein HI914_07355 [Erysiphe necator]|nr:hypothetical protein HI914_07355 [Erysiphe necator]
MTRGFLWSRLSSTEVLPVQFDENCHRNRKVSRSMKHNALHYEKAPLLSKRVIQTLHLQINPRT